MAVTLRSDILHAPAGMLLTWRSCSCGWMSSWMQKAQMRSLRSRSSLPLASQQSSPGCEPLRRHAALHRLLRRICMSAPDQCSMAWIMHSRRYNSLRKALLLQVSANTRATAAAVSERTKSAAAVASQQVLLHIDCSLPHHGLYDLCSYAMWNMRRGPQGMMMRA